MHVRFVTVRRGGNIYRYPQLVQSYRRKKDGMPLHRILANLASLSPQALDNIQLALRAGRAGQAVVLAEDDSPPLRNVQVTANYDFLTVLACWEAWRRLELDTLFGEVLPGTRAQIETRSVVAALVIHRCVDPASKLAATRWFPRTALPELLAISPRQFHNTRIHQALTALHQAGDALRERLPGHIHQGLGPSQAFFLDLTDTWFEGRGPDLAQPGITKEGFFRRRIGLALLCDPRGFPLRWKTLAGRFNDAKVMLDVCGQIKALGWMGHTPLVMDRAMGNASTLLELREAGLRFVTALPVSEFDSWNASLPWASFTDLPRRGAARARERDLEQTATAAQSAGLTPVLPDRRWILDLGLVSHRAIYREPPAGQGQTATMLRDAIAFQQQAEGGDTLERIAQRRGIAVRTVRRYRKLARIVGRARERILAGEAERLGYSRLLPLSDTPPDQQEKALEEQLAQAPARRLGTRSKVTAHAANSTPLTVRLVGIFNPEAFLNQRRALRQDTEQLETFRGDLNRRLRSKSSRRRPGSIEQEVGRELARLDLTEIFTLHVDDVEGRPQVRLERDEDKWLRRQRYHGFNVIATHPDLALGPAEAVELYYAKDAVEKDIQTIKSEVELRPVRHHTDAKVRAHVTLCVLALLLDRWVQSELEKAGYRMKASTAFEMMGPVHLNRLRSGSSSLYSVTKLTPEQRQLAKALGLTDRLRPENLADLLTERPA